jgi:hypothetical protein
MSENIDVGPAMGLYQELLKVRTGQDYDLGLMVDYSRELDIPFLDLAATIYHAKKNEDTLRPEGLPDPRRLSFEDIMARFSRMEDEITSYKSMQIK